MPSQKNIAELAKLKDRLSNAKAILFANYHGLSVADMVKLRAKVAEATGEFTVAKNTLLKLALQDKVQKVREVQKVQEDKNPSISLTADALDTFLKGPTAILIAKDDEIEPLKALVTFSEGNEDIPMVKAAILEDRILSADEVIQLAKLPGRLELQARLVGTLAAPTRGLVTVLSGNLRNLVQVLKAISENSEHSESQKT